MHPDLLRLTFRDEAPCHCLLSQGVNRSLVLGFLLWDMAVSTGMTTFYFMHDNIANLGLVSEHIVRLIGIFRLPRSYKYDPDKFRGALNRLHFWDQEGSEKVHHRDSTGWQLSRGLLWSCGESTAWFDCFSPRSSSTGDSGRQAVKAKDLCWRSRSTLEFLWNGSAV